MPIVGLKDTGNIPPYLMPILQGNVIEDRKDVHVTHLAGCLRQVVLQWEFPYEQSTDNCYTLLKGVIFHAGITHLLDDKVPEHIKIERTLRCDYNGITLVGTPDYVDQEAGILVDWKMPVSLPSEPKDGHEQQLNVYRWMLKHLYDVDINTIQVVYFGTRMQRTFNLKIWRLTEVEEYIDDRLSLILDTQKNGDYPPPEGQMRAGWCRNCAVRSYCEEKL